MIELPIRLGCRGEGGLRVPGQRIDLPRDATLSARERASRHFGLPGGLAAEF